MNAKNKTKTRAQPVRKTGKLRSARHDLSKARRDIATAMPKKQAAARRKDGGEKRKNKQRGTGGLEMQFINALKYPDLVGPEVLPISGAGDRVVTGFSRAVFDLYTESASPVQALCMKPGIGLTGAGNYGGAGSVNVAISTVSGIPWGVSFPAATQVNDWVPTTGCVTCEYIGSELNAGGTVLVGLLNINTTVLPSYAQAQNMPGFVEFPITEVMRNGLVRIPFIHQGPNSWQFLTTTSFAVALAVPYVLLNGSPNGLANALRCTLEMSWMAHPADTANAVPYDSGPRNYTGDADAFQNALAKLGTTALDIISLGFPEVALLRNLLPEWKDIAPIFKSSPKAALKSVAGLRLKRMQTRHPALSTQAGLESASDKPTQDEGFTPIQNDSKGEEEIQSLASRLMVAMSPSVPKRI